MKKFDVIKAVLGERMNNAPQKIVAGAFAPTNIALCKYWGKSNQELNVPMTPSLSISLASKGTATAISVIEEEHDQVMFNGESVGLETKFSRRLFDYLNLFRTLEMRFHIDIASNVPLGAGLASSASGFASLVLALDELYAWKLTQQELSILARLGSGSACRSLWNGFVEWQVGNDINGMDSYGQLLPDEWPEFCVGLFVVNESEKAISSREAMQRTKATSSLYSSWSEKVHADLSAIKEAIQSRDFPALGKAAESNAMTMHAMMLSAWPPISYFQPETIAGMQQIWKLREAGLQLYFTQDAGPNLKLLFLQKDIETIRTHFPSLEILQPFVS